MGVVFGSVWWIEKIGSFINWEIMVVNGFCLLVVRIDCEIIVVIFVIVV